MTDATDHVFDELDETSMMPIQQFKPSKLLGECRVPLNKSETKHFVIGHEPRVEPTNNFELTSSEVKFYTVARIVDRKTNIYVDLEYADMRKLREALSAFIMPVQQQQQQQSYKFPVYLETIQVAKITQDLFCIASRSSSANMLVGRTTLEQLVLMAKQLTALYLQIDSISSTLMREANKIILDIIEKSEICVFESVEDLCGKIEELELEPCLLHTELFLKYPEIYFDIISNIKKSDD